MALVADSFHMLSDIAALVIAFISGRIVSLYHFKVRIFVPLVKIFYDR